MKTLRTRDGFSKTEASYLKNTSNIIFNIYTHPEYVDEDFHLPKIKDVLKLKKIGEKV